MGSIVIDTNVALSWYLNQKPEATEYGRHVLRAILEQDLTIEVPPHWDTEVGAVMLRHLRNPESHFGQDELNRAIREMAVLEVRVHSFLNNFLDVVQAGLEYNLSGYDSPFFHIARMLRCPIATLDKAIIGACQRFGVECFNPGV